MGVVPNIDIYPPSLIIRDGMLDRLRALPTFQNVKLFSPARGKSPYQPEHIPLVAFYRMKETATPDGDANHGMPRFTHDCIFGVMVVVQNNDPVVAEQHLASAHWTILRMLEYQRWWRFNVVGEWQRNPFTNKIDPLKIEAVMRGDFKPVNFGAKGADNTTPYAEQEVDYTIRFRSGFPPYVPDDLDRIHVTVAYPWPYDPNATEPFTVDYDFLSEDYKPHYGSFSVGSPDFAKPALTSRP